ncbi:MAG: hypothetical protein CML45_05520 [Rhodobacteraceae bacterium]|jgi:hypothetical protein|nr:hypothetical protein [Paracoccaceae bacterium]|tara:strand:+ start:1756 stop:2082 length:327 start_codon:yes stop_codon:yes gene_type:complete
MIDLASLVLGSFQDSIESAFGASFGWLIGHMIVLFSILLLIWIVQNRNHIASKSGWGYHNLMDLSVIAFITLAQYFVYVNLLNFPSTASWGLAIFWTMTLRWHILVLE